MSNIKILDCTLREGGYINDWNFGKDEILSILDSLNKAKLDYVEAGYLKDNAFYNSNKTVFSDISQLCAYNYSNLFLMINYGEVEIDNLNDTTIGLSIAFKKKDYVNALEYCSELVEKGFRIFINPMSINLYSFEELDEIIEKINLIRPFASSIVDSFGSMNVQDIIQTFNFINSKLNNGIALSLHLHDGLNQAMSAVERIVELEKSREIIIQTSINGIGRGVGNLKTEDFVNALNFTLPYKAKSEYELAVYRLSARKNIHPNYAKLLIENKVSFSNCDKLLDEIPKEFRAVFSKKVLEEKIKYYPVG